MVLERVPYVSQVWLSPTCSRVRSANFTRSTQSPTPLQCRSLWPGIYSGAVEPSLASVVFIAQFIIRSHCLWSFQIFLLLNIPISSHLPPRKSVLRCRVECGLQERPNLLNSVSDSTVKASIRIGTQKVSLHAPS